MDGKVEKAEPKFDWVTERSQCSLPKVFYALRLQVEEDVKTRNSLRPANAPYEFSVAEDIDDFKVILEAQEVREAVIFCLGEHSISVKDDKGNQKFEVIPTFSEDGKCNLYINQEQREFWQVRRMALEELMFRGN